MRSIRNIWIDRCDIQNSGELSAWTKDGCSRTAQAGVPRTEMLHTMDCHRSLLRDARAYAIGTLHMLRPDPTHPDAPVFEFVGSGRVAAIVDKDAVQ